ncbi:hypothetical protein RGV33_17085 [Pseudomonas sp. Bout1]|uniref:hypothetical protein n=1 Tax=Pseudomonas sp. Bout1 TaxID=3048600 RepID=UPI002AB5B6A8|nr:hypothetical protein [Pseudomonas sp. Bout1]MDY7533377.1 hypothetical protein [Pseudomonas sp. Bout1]MEB0188286.1 hypothetical protein [Pseudomonas sp. Bout1]
MGDRQNLRTLGQKLNDVATRLGVNATPQAVQAALQSTPLDIHPDSSYATQAGSAATLASFIGSLGLSLPASHFSLTGLAHSVGDKALVHPLGNFGGGLSWPVPLSVSGQRVLLIDAMRYAGSHPNSPQQGAAVGVLEFLNHPTAVSAETLQDPAHVLETLVSSPRGQALGQAMQTKLNGIGSETSVNEYVLTAMNLVLDPESIATPHRNKVAGFDLAQPDHWGKPASAVLDGLRDHLQEGTRTSPEMAGAGAYLLLARKAPEFLVKHIPDSVTYGSMAWVSLAVAAATIEAQTPGKVPNMTYAQVMSAAENAGLQDLDATRHAQASALANWGVANGILAEKADDDYSPADLETVRAAFNQQMTQRREASRLLEVEIPSRKDIALAKLKERFGENVPFEEKLLAVVDSKQPSIQPLYDPNRAPAGRFSMLDIAMSGLEQYKWESEDPRILEATAAKPLKLDVNSTFDTQYAQAITSRKTGIGTTVKHLIAHLPLADRQHLESAGIEFFQKKTYTLGTNFTTRTLKETDKRVWMKASGNHDTVYEIDLHKGHIKKVPASELTTEKARQANTIFKTQPFIPKGVDAAQFGRTPAAGPSVIPASFSSPRTQAIADAFVEHLDIDSADVKSHAAGVTAFDQQNATEWNVTNFFLDLIPLRSAIVNFQNGHYLDGATDLLMDVFGFVTAGAAAAAKVVKVAGQTLSLAAKALKVTKIVGATTVGAFNPLDGLGDLIAGGAKLAGKGINKLKGASGSYDLLKAASNHYNTAAIGTLNVAESTVEGGAVLQKGKWYAFDADKMRPYGPPLEGFVPKVAAIEGNVQGIRHFNSWLSSVVAPNVPTPELPLVFEKVTSQAKAIDGDAFKKGYDTGNPDTINGYYPSMTLNQLKELTVAGGHAPEDIGTLFRLIEKNRVEVSLNNFKYFNNEVTAAGGVTTAMPQGFYLSQTDLLSKGECAALSNAMALAIQEKREHVLIENFFSAIANPNLPAAIKFRNNLTNFQDILKNQFHGTQDPLQISHLSIISELGTSPRSKTLLIRDEGHGLTAGVVVENNQKHWFYFDPNFGLAKFPTQQSMEKGLESLLNSGKTSALLEPYGVNRAVPEYRVVEFSELDLMNTTKDVTSVSRLFNTRV